MLVRAMFESVVVGSWARVNPETALELLLRNAKYQERVRWEAYAKYTDWVVKPEPEPAALTAPERAEAEQLFGKFAERAWTGHTSVRVVLREVEPSLPEEIRKILQRFAEVLVPEHNWLVHSSPLALFSRIRLDESTRKLKVNIGASPAFVLNALVDSTALQHAMLQLYVDHFALDGFRGPLEEAYTQVMARLRQAAEQTAVPKVGRNDPCPCGSGRKYKRCHGT